MQFLIALIPLALFSISQASPLNSMASGTGCTGGLLVNETVLDGDGNPHQSFVFQQISNIIDCDDNPGGSVSVSNTTSVGWSATLGFSSDFVSLGFTVDQTFGTGQTEASGCKTNNGTHTGGLCMFKRVQMTDFTAKHRTYDTACGVTKKYEDVDFGIISAPNIMQQGCFYNNFQLNLECDYEGKQHVFKVGIPGGSRGNELPPHIDCTPWLPPGVSHVETPA